MWILIIWSAVTNPPLVEFGYFPTKQGCESIAQAIMLDKTQSRETFCILGAEDLKVRIVRKSNNRKQGE